MIIYYLFLFLSFVVMFFTEDEYVYADDRGFFTNRRRSLLLIFFFGIIIFFCGLRSGIADTGTYIQMFNRYPTNIGKINLENVDEKGFYILGVLYKQFISHHYQGWLFIICLVSAYSLYRTIFKYSSNIGMSCFLFISSTMFVYLFNGIRQFIVVSIMMNCMNYIVERKIFPYMLMILILSTIHTSAIVLIPFYFVDRIKPLSVTMWFVLFIVIILSIFVLNNNAIINDLLVGTNYDEYIEILENGVGVNIMRLLISIVPCGIVILGRKQISQNSSNIIDLSINAAFITSALYFVALFTSGLVLGRILIYFEVYNLILMPWLLDHAFTYSTSKMVKFLCVVFYCIFFFVQMQVTWKMNYVSDFLGIRV